MAKRYKWPSDWRDLGKDFSSLFKISIVDFYDPFASWLLGQFIIDIYKLDEHLHIKYGDYEEEGLSMRELIESKYGSTAVELLEEIT